MHTAPTLALVFLLFSGVGVYGQDVVAPEASTPPEATPAPERAQRLDRYRRIVENVEDSDSTRIAQAEELLLTGWPEATDLLVAMLLSEAPPPAKGSSSKLVVCQAIALVGRSKPEVLNDKLVAPLLALLGSPDEAVASQAGEALAAFPNGEVVNSLSELAANPEAPLSQRLASIRALVPNMDRRPVVAALVGLLDTQEPELTARIVEALAHISNTDHKNDLGAWRQWWEKQSALSDSAWSQAQVRQLLQRASRTEQELAAVRRDCAAKHDRLAGRLTAVLASNFRLTLQPEKRDELLVAWFSDPAVEFRRVAASLVAEQISEGNPPSKVVHQALRERFKDESPEIRKVVAEIVGALSEPADAEAMLSRLGTEPDEGVRETMLRVLGKLRNPAAIPVLIAELNREGVPDASLAAAADAVGTLAGRGQVGQEVIDSLIGPLKSRFAASNAESRLVRVALLGSMAAIGSPEFKPEFAANLSADDPELLLRAIQGVAVVGGAAELDRLGNLLVHADARVRQRAMVAVGVLGGEEQLAIILPRLSRSVEPMDGPREAAWQAFKQIGARLPISAQVSVAEKLSDHPALAVEYLKELHDRLTPMQPPPAELANVRRKLADLLGSLERHTEALLYWRQLHAAAVQANDPGAHDLALQLLACALAGDRLDRIDEALTSLEDASAEQRQTAENALITYAEQVKKGDDKDRTTTVITKLKSVSSSGKWPALSEYVRPKTPTDKPKSEPTTQPAKKATTQPAQPPSPSPAPTTQPTSQPSTPE